MVAFIQAHARGLLMDPGIKERSSAALEALSKPHRSLRHSVPSQQEIMALVCGDRPTFPVFFLDSTFEECPYDATTTVGEALEVTSWFLKRPCCNSCRPMMPCPAGMRWAGCSLRECSSTVGAQEVCKILGVSDASTLALYRRQKLSWPPVGNDTDTVPGEAVDAFVLLSESAYIGDLFAETARKQPEDAAGGGQLLAEGTPRRSSQEHARMGIFLRKRIFPSGEEPALAQDIVLTHLSYIQARLDYLAGFFSVTTNEAASLAALQAIAESTSDRPAAEIAR